MRSSPVGLSVADAARSLHKTTYWGYRACRAAVAGASGHLSGPFRELAGDEQGRAILSLLNPEAVAVAQLLFATIWLSEQAVEGVLRRYSTINESPAEPFRLAAPSMRRNAVRSPGASVKVMPRLPVLASTLAM